MDAMKQYLNETSKRAFVPIIVTLQFNGLLWISELFSL